MHYNSPLIEGRLKKRYKRFLADVELPTGELITAHCANTGAMTGCMPHNARVWLSHSTSTTRKYPYSWELVELENQALACINTSLTNRIAREALEQGVITELAGFDRCLSEVAYGCEKSRIDLLTTYGEQNCYIEVKHVTLRLESGEGAFPDAVTTRGQKHIRELEKQIEQGHRSVMLFIIMRTDVDLLTPAVTIDPVYADLLVRAQDRGVEILAYKAAIDLSGIQITGSIPVNMSI